MESMQSQPSQRKFMSSPRAIIYLLIFCQWMFALSFIYATVHFLSTGKPIDFVVSLFLLRWSITSYQLKVVYNHGIVRDYMTAVLEKNIMIEKIKRIGRRDRRKYGISLAKIIDSLK